MARPAGWANERTFAIPAFDKPSRHGVTPARLPDQPPRRVVEHAGGYGIGLDYARDMIKPA